MRNAIHIFNLLESAQVAYSIEIGSNLDNVMWDEASIHSVDVRAHNFFIGLAGEHTNGGKFAQEALDRGASLLMIEPQYASNLTITQTCAIIVVENALLAMSLIAKEIRRQLRGSCTFIGVTGSAGKTTTKSILYQLLNAHVKAVCSKGNLNTMQGMSLCLLNTNFNGIQYAILECGISAEGEMQTLVQVLDPDYAIITNVGHAHMGGYSNLTKLRQEKLSIATRINSQGTLWLPENDLELNEEANAMNFSCQVATHGSGSFKRFTKWIDKQLGGVEVHCDDMVFSSPLIGESNMINLLTALQVMDHFAFPRSITKKATSLLTAERGRYQILSTKPLIIDDAYNASPEAVVHSMQWFSSLAMQPKIAVLAGMKELGAESVALHQNLIASCAKLAIEHIFLFGEEYDQIALVERHIQKMSNTDKIIDVIHSIYTRDCAILFKGSRYYRLETIAQKLL